MLSSQQQKPDSLGILRCLCSPPVSPEVCPSLRTPFSAHLCLTSVQVALVWAGGRLCGSHLCQLFVNRSENLRSVPGSAILSSLSLKPQSKLDHAALYCAQRQTSSGIPGHQIHLHPWRRTTIRCMAFSKAQNIYAIHTAGDRR